MGGLLLVLCKAAKVAFGAPAKHPHREHIDGAAWVLICDRRTVKTWCRERRFCRHGGYCPWAHARSPLGVHVGL